MLYIENMTELHYSLLSNIQGLLLCSALGFYIKYRSKNHIMNTPYFDRIIHPNVRVHLLNVRHHVFPLSMLVKVLRMDGEIISTFTFKHFFLVIQNSNMITFTNVLLVLFMVLVQVNWMHIVLYTPLTWFSYPFGFDC